MLARPYRLKKREVKRVYQKGKVQANSGIILRSLPNRTDHFRLAVVIPKSVIKLATKRNRLKRKTMEVIEKMTLPKVDIIISFKRAIEEDKLEEMIKNYHL